MTRFSHVEACVFDAYGTLFDVHSAVDQHRKALGCHADAISVLWRNKQLEYTWLRSLMQHHADFWQVTGDALDYALEAFEVEDATLRSALMQAYLQLQCYDEVIEVLTKLKACGIRTAILSNGSPDMLNATISHAGLDTLLDQCLSVETVGIYKPDPRVYQLAVDSLSVSGPQAISFQSSNAWDVAGAAFFGFQVAWINRFGQRRERLPAKPSAELRTLRELPSVLGLSQ